jgi:monofunctional biosynthetic peptidoglycan transglycosylase
MLNTFAGLRTRLSGIASRLIRGRLKWPIMAAFAVLLFMVLDVARYFVYPDVSALIKKNPATTQMMQLRQQEWKAAGKGVRIRQEWVSLGRISPSMISAVLIAEDDKFWSHEGFDFDGIEKALEKNIRKGRFSAGGSTITQQLAKNLYLSPYRNPIRKLKEAILAWRIERTLSKKRILEIYLNVAEWGDGIFGVEAAARHYYGLPASSLGPLEASRLASVLPNPRKYSPTSSSSYVGNRSRIIYKIMSRRGLVVLDEPEDPLAESETEPAGPSDDTMSNLTGMEAAPAFTDITALDLLEPSPGTDTPMPDEAVGQY